jgi:isoquinoline 1-oxidoreductase alpha subunit
MTRIIVNGQAREIDAEPGSPLLWALREDLGLTGAKYGCGAAQCGACLVHVDGEPTPSCVTAISDVEGKSITTIEGLKGKVAEAVLTAWVNLEAAQCGYCQPGQIMAAAALLASNPKPTDADIDSVMSGNVCRCGTYQRIRAAIHEAARILQG